MTVKDRLKFMLEQKGIKPSFFCREIGVSKGYINSIRNSISPKVINEINAKFAGEIDTYYLLTGKDPKSREVTISTDSLFKRIHDEQLKSKDQALQIIELNATVKKRDETIEKLKKQISILEKKITR